MGWIFYMIPKKRECDKWEKEGWWGRRKFKCTTEFLKFQIFVSVQTKKEIKASTFLKFLIFCQKYFIRVYILVLNTKIGSFGRTPH